MTFEAQNSPEQEVPEGDVVIPMIGGEMTLNEIKANFNALLYLLTEFMGVNLKLLDLLLEKEVTTSEEINEKVLSVTGNKEELTQIYNELFSRFVGYVNAIHQLQAEGKIFKASTEAKTENSNES